ncbi:MAG: flippase [Methanomassiliicoccales archaeon]
MLIITSRLLANGLAFVGLLLIFRYLGQETYGTIQWSLSLVATINAVADLGFNHAHLKRMSEGRDPSDCVSTFVVTKLALTGSMTLLVLGGVSIWTMMGNTLTDTSMDIILLFVLYHVFHDIAHIATFTFDAKLQSAKAQLSILMDPLLRLPFIVIVALYGLSDTALAFTYVIGGLGFAVTAQVLLMRDGFVWKRPTLFRPYFQFALPIATIIIITVLSENIDRILIGLFWSSASVGSYAAGLRMVEMLSIIGVAITNLIFPFLSKLYAEGRLEEVKEKTAQAERYIAMLALPAVVLLFLFPSQIATLFLGSGAGEVGPPLRFLALAIFLNLLNEVHVSQINAMNRPELAAKLRFLGLAINVGVLLLLVPTSLFGFTTAGLGAEGAAIAKLVEFSALFLMIRFAVFRLAGVVPNHHLLRMVPGALLASGLLYLLGEVWSPAGPIALLMYGLLSLGLFVSLFALSGEVTRRDFDFLLRAINPREMLDYIRSELRRE